MNKYFVTKNLTVNLPYGVLQPKFVRIELGHKYPILRLVSMEHGIKDVVIFGDTVLLLEDVRECYSHLEAEYKIIKEEENENNR